MAAYQPDVNWITRSLLNDAITTQGVAVAQRIGRGVRLLYIDFLLRLIPMVSITAQETPDVSDCYGNACRVCVVHDTDAYLVSGAATYASELYPEKVWDLANVGSITSKFATFAAAAPITTAMYAMRNMDYKQRFRIKKDLIHVMTTTALNGTAGTAYARASTGEGVYSFRVPFVGGLKLQFQSDSQSANVDKNVNFVKNDVFIMYCANSGGCCTIQYKARAVFVDA